jgi:TRAP transporter TAXI family solute receptor
MRQRESGLTLRHKLLLIVAAAVVLAGAIAAATFYFTYQPTTFTVAVGPTGGENVRIMQALAQQFARERASIRLRIMVSEGGPAESAAAIDRGTADIAVIRGDLGIPANAQVVAILRHNVVVLLVPAAGTRAPKDGRKAKPAKIENIQQLSGRRIGVVSRADANLQVLDVILKQYDIPDSKVQVITLDPNDVAAAIHEDKVDALLVTGPSTGRLIADVVAAASTPKEGPTFLAIGESEAIERRFPNYESTEIVGNAFGSSPPKPPDAVETIGFVHYVVARRSLSEDTVAEFAQLLYGARQTLSADVPGPIKIEAPSTDKDATVPVHPGAAAYIDGNQKTFFDRYNDLLYWGVILLSFCGSATAGLAGYLRAGKRAHRTELLERLIELMRAARTAETLPALDAVQAEADEILASTIREVEHNSIEERTLTAFTLALDQARLAIADRRATLSQASAETTSAYGIAGGSDSEARAHQSAS